MTRILRYWRAAAVAAAPFAVYLVPRGWIFSEGHPLCLFRNITGHECPGCGMTRALASLAYLDPVGAWHYNRAVVVVAPLLAWLWIRWIVRLSRDAARRGGDVRG